MGRDQYPDGPALFDCSGIGGEEVLALSGEVPHLINAESPRPRIEAIRIVDMSSSNSWAGFAAIFRSTRNAFLEHERAKSELKALIPEDAKEAIGHGVRAKRSKSGAVTFDLLETEVTYA